MRIRNDIKKHVTILNSKIVVDKMSKSNCKIRFTVFHFRDNFYTLD